MTMKVLIVSDTHGKHKNLEKVLDLVRPIDLMIHLGDAQGHEDYIAEIYRLHKEQAHKIFDLVFGDYDVMDFIEYHRTTSETNMEKMRFINLKEYVNTSEL